MKGASLERQQLQMLVRDELLSEASSAELEPFVERLVGKVVSSRDFRSHAAALESAGLEE
jgi:hypothetical protein